MANLSFLIFALFGVFFHGCLARQFGFESESGWQLNSLEPTTRSEHEAGVIEFWDRNAPQLQWAGVGVFRVTIRPNGLYLPVYRSNPSLGYVVSGEGIRGVVIPGCPETYQDSQRFQQGPQGEWGQAEQIPDMHQKVEQLREGDAIALPEGVTEWYYNDGQVPLVIILLLHENNPNNQLDRNSRSFLIAGNEPQRHQIQGQQGQQQESHGQHGQRVGKNLLSGFKVNILAQSFEVDHKTARELQNEGDKRGNIVFAKGGLQVVRPPTKQEIHSGPKQDNGFEETVCSLKLQENLNNPRRADVYAPHLGRISILNSFTLPVLRQLSLSAIRGVLLPRTIYLPHWNLNSHAVIYVTEGEARVQVVDDNGDSVFDGQLQQGQLLVVPQGFAVVKRAKQNGFKFITFKTNDNAIIQTLAGRTSVIKSLPEQVLENAYQISPREAREIEYNTIETTLTKAKSRGPKEYDDEE